jgi:hypothetical protein
MGLLIRGNEKLGGEIWHWSLPAIVTCPGKTRVCEKICYATIGHYNQTSVKKRLESNLDSSRKSWFPGQIIEEVQRQGIEVVRIHASGDFYDEEYIRKWIEIIELCPDTRFYTYTRSWRVEELVRPLEELARLDNMQMWYSADREDSPVKVPDRVRVAYLQDRSPRQGKETDLLFRTKPLRVIGKGMDLPMVCPVELPTSKDVTCSSCKHCWS